MPEIVPSISKLENGVRILVDSEQSFSTVGLSICLLGGSREESESTIGLTHLLEHLIFKRTVSKSALEVAQIVDSLGGDANASTDTDSLVLSGRVMREDFLALANLFSELLFECFFTEEDLNLEREVVRQEILESVDDPEEATYDAYSREFWPNSSLGLPVFGTTESIGRFTVEQIESRLREMLVGSRVVVAVCGNINEQEVIDWATKTFGSLPVGDLPEHVAVKSSGGYVEVSRSISQTHILLGCPWPHITSNKFIAGHLVSVALGDCMSSRLFQTIREKHGLCYDISSCVDAYEDTASLIIGSVVERVNLEKSLELISGEIELLISESFMTEEIERARSMWKYGLSTERGSLSSRLTRLIESEVIFKRYVSASEDMERLQSVKEADLKEVVEEYLNKSNFLLALGGEVNEVNLPEGVKNRLAS